MGKQAGRMPMGGGGLKVAKIAVSKTQIYSFFKFIF